MNNLTGILTLIVGTLICTYIIPWYFIAIIGMTTGYMWKLNGLNAFGIGLLIPALTWILIVLFQGSNQDVSIANILSDLFGGVSSLVVFAFTGLTIGFISGLAMLSGNILYKIKAK